MQGTLGTVIVISVAAMAIMWAVDETTNIWGPLIRKILLVGFWSYMITNWQSLAMAAISAFGKLGISAGGGAAGLSDFLNSPSKVFLYGVADAKAIIDFCAYSLGDKTTGWGVMPGVPDPNLLDVGPYIAFVCKEAAIFIEAMVCAIILVIAYGWIALEIVAVVIEFHIVTLVAFIVLPFGILSQTSSLAENAIAYVFRAGFKAMVLGLVIALGTTFLTSYTLTEAQGATPTLDTFCGLGLSVVIILILALQAPQYAAAVVSGSPSTGAGGIAGVIGGIGGGMLAAGKLGQMALGQANKVGAALSGDGGSASSNAAAAGASRGSSPPGSPPSSTETGGQAGASAGVAASSGIGSSSSSRSSPSQPSGFNGVSAGGGAAASGTATSPWYDQKGGVAALTPDALAHAEGNYETYLALNPNPPEGFNFERFVEVGQADHVDPVSPVTV
ncbi:MAG: type IV secretion system protein [Caulobacteraceae bacterium]